MSRFLHLINKSPGGIVPDDGLYLANWATQILAIYDDQRRVGVCCFAIIYRRLHNAFLDLKSSFYLFDVLELLDYPEILQIIAIPYSQLDMEMEEAVESFPIQQLRASMRARRSSIGSSEGSSINDSVIRVDVS